MIAQSDRWNKQVSGNQGLENGTLKLSIVDDANTTFPAALYYQCELHCTLRV